MADVNRRYFESLMQGKDLSLRALASRMGLGHSQLSLTFSGLRKLQLDEAAQLSSIFGEPLHRIVEAAGVQVRSFHNHMVSVVGAMQGDGTVALHPQGVLERTHAPELVPEDGVAIQARTAGSALEWMDGWVFFCEKPGRVDPASLGRLAFCQIKGGPAVVASVRRGYQEGSYNLRGLYTADSVRLESAAPVLITRN
ncbi:MAG: hypothetical protein ACRCTG_16470 [Aestuariivirga sp.]